MFKEFFLTGDGSVTSGHFGAIFGIAIAFGELDIDNCEGIICFCGGYVGLSVFFAVDIGARMVTRGALTVFFGGSRIVVTEEGDICAFGVDISGGRIGRIVDAEEEIGRSGRLVGTSAKSLEAEVLILFYSGDIIIGAIIVVVIPCQFDNIGTNSGNSVEGAPVGAEGSSISTTGTVVCEGDFVGDMGNIFGT